MTANEQEIRQKAQQQGLSEQQVTEAVQFAKDNPDQTADQVVQKIKGNR